MDSVLIQMPFVGFDIISAERNVAALNRVDDFAVAKRDFEVARRNVHLHIPCAKHNGNNDCG